MKITRLIEICLEARMPTTLLADELFDETFTPERVGLMLDVIVAADILEDFLPSGATLSISETKAWGDLFSRMTKLNDYESGEK